MTDFHSQLQQELMGVVQVGTKRREVCGSTLAIAAAAATTLRVLRHKEARPDRYGSARSFLPEHDERFPVPCACNALRGFGRVRVQQVILSITS